MHFTANCEKITYFPNRELIYEKLKLQRNQERRFAKRRKVKKEKRICFKKKKQFILRNSINGKRLSLIIPGKKVDPSEIYSAINPKNSSIISREELNLLIERSRKRESKIKLISCEKKNLKFKDEINLNKSKLGRHSKLSNFFCDNLKLKPKIIEKNEEISHFSINQFRKFSNISQMVSLDSLNDESFFLFFIKKKNVFFFQDIYFFFL